jgi:uncharacterized RDD family membrane protein YckC
MDNNFSETMSGLYQYTGFWPRVGASIIDTILLLSIIFPLLITIYGWDYLDSEEIIAGPADALLNYLFPIIAVVAFWFYKQATPGKMMINAQLVDAKTGGRPTIRQYLIRYIGYIIATVPFGLGIFWVAWDKKKQGWHDKMAGTVVINLKKTNSEDVSFKG